MCESNNYFHNYAFYCTQVRNSAQHVSMWPALACWPGQNRKLCFCALNNKSSVEICFIFYEGSCMLTFLPSSPHTPLGARRNTIISATWGPCDSIPLVICNICQFPGSEWMFLKVGAWESVSVLLTPLLNNYPSWTNWAGLGGPGGVGVPLTCGAGGRQHPWWGSSVRTGSRWLDLHDNHGYVSEWIGA